MHLLLGRADRLPLLPLLPLVLLGLLAMGVLGQSLPPDFPNCLLVDEAARTIKSDADGVGDGAFIAQNCTARITCPAGQGVSFNFVGEAKGTAYFLVKPYRVLLGQTLPNNLFAAWNPHGVRMNLWQSFDTNEAIIMYAMMTPADSNRVGGFEITWNCFSNCPANDLPAAITDPGERGVVKADIAGTPPIICRTTLSAPTCPAGMRVSYDFVRRPEYYGPNKIYDPWWKLLWLQDPSPGDVIFPNSFNATEQYLEPRDVTIQTMSLYNGSLSWEVHYYCTPVAQLPDAGTGGLVSLAETTYGAILSDADGEGPIPYVDAPVAGEWGIVCPYDLNVATTEISAIFGASGQQALQFTPVLGTNTVWRDQIVGYTNIPWGSPALTVNFSSPSNGNKSPDNPRGGGGFTVKYNCTDQCALGPPSRVTGASPLVLDRTWTALQPWADMCRWEVETSCGAEENIKVTVIKAPLVSETFKLVVDYFSEWFKFVYPDKNQGSTLYLRRGPFNASVRAFNGTDAGFELRTECINSAVCGQPWSAASVGGAAGVVTSDSDGLGPYPYIVEGCTKTISCDGAMVVNAQGGLGAGHSLVVRQPNEDSEGPWRTFTGTFDDKQLSVQGPLTLTLEHAVSSAELGSAPLAPAPTGTPGGFTVSYTCTITPSPPGETTTTGGGAVPVPTTTTTGAATPTETTPTGTPESSTSLAPTTTLPPTTTPAPTPPPTTTGAPPPPTTAAPPTNATNVTLGAPEDDDIGLIVGAAVGGVIGLLLLCCLILFIVLRVKNLTLRDEDGRWFADGTKYTKGFDVHGDAELEALSGQRAQNDMLANDDLTSIHLMKQEAPSPAVRPGAAAPVIDHEDI